MTDLALAIEQFNNGEYFEQHETLERMWRAEPGPVRELYQGILQIGVGFYHLQRGNYAGTLHLLERGLQRLAPLAPACLGIDVARLIAETQRCREAIAALAADQDGDFNWHSAPRIHFINSGATSLDTPRVLLYNDRGFPAAYSGHSRAHGDEQ